MVKIPLLELICFLNFFSTYYLLPVYYEYISNRVCDTVWQTSFGNSSSPNSTWCDNSDSVSSKTSTWINLLNAMASIPSILVLAFFGAASDVIGRKIPMFISLIGNTLQYAGITFVVYYNMNLNYLYIFSFISGITGGFSLLLMTLFAAMADLSDGVHRTIRINILEGAITVGVCVGGLCGGFFVSDIGFTLSMLIPCILSLLAAILVFFVTETLPISKRRLENFHWWKSNLFKKAVQVCRHRDLAILMSAFFLRVSIYLGIMSLQVTFVQHEYPDFSDRAVSYYIALDLLTKSICLIVLVPLLKPLLASGRLSEILCIQIGGFADVASVLFLGFVINRYALFGSRAFGFVSALGTPMTRALLSKFTPKSEQGSVFAAVAIVEAVCSFAGTFLMNGIYSETVNTSPGIAFAVGAVMMGSVIVLVQFARNSPAEPLESDASSLDESSRLLLNPE